MDQGEEKYPFKKIVYISTTEENMASIEPKTQIGYIKLYLITASAQCAVSITCSKSFKTCSTEARRDSFFT